MLKNMSLDSYMVKLGKLNQKESSLFCLLYFSLSLQRHLGKYDKNDKKGQGYGFCPTT